MSETILEEAQRLVHGPRQADYGHPFDHYTMIGKMWGAMLDREPLDPRIVCLMMAALKIARDVNASKRDNRTDLAGYAACAEMVAERELMNDIEAASGGPVGVVGPIRGE